MSTYYYMGCDDHKCQTRTMIAVTRISGQHIDSPNELLNFLMKHLNCNLRFFSEYDDERCAYTREPSPGKETK